MKKIFLSAIIVLLHFSVSTAAGNRTAVVDAKYDRVELVLKAYRIPYELIKFKDLDDESTFRKYDSIFFPSGMSSPHESNIDIRLSGKEIKSVKLSKDFFELDREKFARRIKEFTERGGAAYFSGYSFKLISDVYGNFEFFHDFPYMGMPGRIEASVRGDLSRFSLKKKSALYMDYTGWITLKSVKDAELLSEARFMTPRGEKFGPISILMKRGEGEILYTSYYSTVFSEFRRFNIYRVAGYPVQKKLCDAAEGMFQTVTGRISDAFINNENSRTYLFNLSEGSNTIYLSSQSVPFMFEIYDSDMSLLASVEKQNLNQTFDIRSGKNDYCFVKIYPAGSSRFSIYSIVSAEGKAISFDFINVKSISLALISFIFIAALAKVTLARLN